MVRKSVLVQEVISHKSSTWGVLEEVTKGEECRKRQQGQLNAHQSNCIKSFGSGSAPLLSKLFGLPKAFALCTTARCALSPRRGVEIGGARGEWI